MISIDFDQKGKVVVQVPHTRSALGRRMPGARWSAARKVWYSLPTRLVKQYVADNLVPIATEISEPVRTWLNERHELRVRQFLPTYRFRTRPYRHQEAGVAHVYGRRTAAVFAEPGTGKTKMVVDACSALFLSGDITHVIVFSPLSVRTTWRREWSVHSPVRSDVHILNRKLPELRKPLALQVLVVGIESMSAGKAYEEVVKFAFSSMGNCAVIVDEAHLIKNHSAKRTEKITTIGHSCKHRYILTGTPIANSLADYYSQFYFLDPEIIGLPDFYSFRDRYCVMGGYENRQIIGYENLEELQQSVNPYIFRAKKEDCLDLPPKVHQTRECALLPDQKRFYDRLKKDKAADSITTVGPLDLALRLHQIAGGFKPRVIRNDEDETQVVSYELAWGESPKMAELFQLLEDSGDQPTIVWCAYRHEIEYVAQALRVKFGHDAVVEIHGGVSESDRQAAVDAMQSGKARFLVGTASAGGVGITVTAATLVVYYSNTFSYVNRVQSEDRAHRAGQTRTVTVVDLVTPSTIDESIIAALDAKMDLATWMANHGDEVL